MNVNNETRALILDACNQLHAQGIKPTQINVRQLLVSAGNGKSNNDIVFVLREWKAQNTGAKYTTVSNETSTEIPREVLDVFQQNNLLLWTALSNHYKNVITDLENTNTVKTAVLNNELELLKEESEESMQETERLETENIELNTALTQALDLNRQLQLQLDNLSNQFVTEKTALTDKIALQDKELSDLKTQLSNNDLLLKKAQYELEQTLIEKNTAFEKLTVQESSIIELKVELGVKTSKIELLEKSLIESNNKVQSLEDSLIESNKQVSKLDGMLVVYQAIGGSASLIQDDKKKVTSPRTKTIKAT